MQRTNIDNTTPNPVDNLQQDWNWTNEMSRVFDLVKLTIITRDVGQGNTVTPSSGRRACDMPSENWYDVAISPGYGISGLATDSTAVIPTTDLRSLQEGEYFVYALGLNDASEIVALDQSEVRIDAGA